MKYVMLLHSLKERLKGMLHKLFTPINRDFHFVPIVRVFQTKSRCDSPINRDFKAFVLPRFSSSPILGMQVPELIYPKINCKLKKERKEGMRHFV